MENPANWFQLVALGLVVVIVASIGLYFLFEAIGQASRRSFQRYYAKRQKREKGEAKARKKAEST